MLSRTVPCDYRCNTLHSCIQFLISYICISPPSSHVYSPSSPDAHFSLPATSLPANSPPTSHSAPSSSVTAVPASSLSTRPHQQPAPRQPRQQPTRQQPARRRPTRQRRSPVSSSESSDSESEPAARVDRRTDALNVEYLCHVPPDDNYHWNCHNLHNEGLLDSILPNRILPMLFVTLSYSSPTT